MTELADIISVSWKQTIRTRPWGVVLSIAFGIAAFLILGVLGSEIRQKLGDDFLLMGGVNVMRVEMQDDRYPGSELHYFSNNSIEAIRKLENVNMVGKNVRNSMMYPQTIDNQNLPLQLFGVDEFFVPIHFLEVEEGRAFNSDDVQKGQRVCMLGHQAAVQLFGSPANAIGKYINIGHNDIARVIGVLNGVMLASWTSYAFIPSSTLLDRKLSISEDIDRLFVYTKNWENVPEIADNIVKKVQELQDAPHVVVDFQREQFKRIDATFFWLATLLWLAIGLSLVLGAFGIWSGTFTAVRGRTHEIGLKKAMGATNLDIMAQILLEALFKAVAGGILGLLIGLIVVFTGIYYLKAPLPVEKLIWCATIGVLFSAFLGIAGGILPALRASRMDVVESLRFE